MRHHVLPIATLLLLAGCAAGQRPPLPVVGVAADVNIAAAVGAWRGWPADLRRFVTPIHVSLDNHGAIAVRVSHDDFTLVVGGRQLPPVLPYQVRGVVYAPPPPELPSAGFSSGATGSPARQDWALRGSTTAAEADPARVGEQFELPSPDVLDHALREGVVHPGGAASGFVYFERLDTHASPVDLAVRLVDARTGRVIGRVVIPLVPR